MGEEVVSVVVVVSAVVPEVVVGDGPELPNPVHPLSNAITIIAVSAVRVRGSIS